MSPMKLFGVWGTGSIVWLGSLIIPAHAEAQCSFNWRPGDGVPGVHQPIFAMTTWDPDGPGPQAELLVVGGTFTVAGDVLANHVAAWNGTSWAAIGTGMNDNVNALTVYNGKLIAAGYFTTAGGTSASHIAQWDGTSWQPMAGGMNNSVYALNTYNGNLIAAGQFTTAGGASIRRIARWDGTSWQALGSGINDDVYALTVYNGNLIAGGRFTTAGGISANRIAQWNGTSWNALSSGMNSDVRALAVQDGNLIAGGSFTSASGLSANHIAQWNGTGWQALGNGIGTVGDVFPYVVSLMPYNGKLIAGGYFTSNSVTPADGIAQWDGISWTAFGTALLLQAEVLAMTSYNGDLIAAGQFQSAGGLAVTNIAEWNGTSWTALGRGINDRASALAVYKGNLIAGGTFLSAGDASARRIAQWDGTSWSALSTGVSWEDHVTRPEVYAFALYNGNLIVGGTFNTAGAVSATGIAQWDGVDWKPLGSEVNGIVQSLMVYDGKLIAGGTFTLAGDPTFVNIAQWDGTSWTALGTGTSGFGVYALTLYNGNLIAAGNFTTAGGISANYIAQWNGTAWEALGSGMSAPGGGYPYPEVYALTVYNGNLIAGGAFTAAGGLSAKYIAQWNGTNWTALGAGTGGGDPGHAFPFVYALTNYNGNLIAGGDFTTADGVSANRIAQWDGMGWTSQGSGTSALVLAMTLYNDDLIAGGDFSTAGGNVSAYWARWGPNCLRGDMNCDQVVDEADVPLLVNALLADGPLSTCDAYTANVNGDVMEDGTPIVNGEDIASFVRLVAGGQ